MTAIKVCGITRTEDMLMCSRLGVDAVGINFWPGSRRYVTPEKAADILQHRGGRMKIFGVFVNAPLAEIVTYTRMLSLDFIQLHGDEREENIRQLRDRLPRAQKVGIIKAIRVRNIFPEKEIAAFSSISDGLLFDSGATGAYGGSGVEFDYGALEGVGLKLPMVLLSGGLNAGNVERAVRLVKPHMVDVCSGVETAPGVKDEKKLEFFVEALRRASE
jgi:phosphoribosylanthranilate isomerase